jgi:hypothetical protein
MKHRQKHLSAGLIALAAILTAAPMAAWAATAPNLGTAASFAVLGVGSAIPPSTAADPTTAVTTSGTAITGDVGSAGAVTLTGSNINGNVILSGAFVNTGSTYSSLSTPLPVQVINDFNTAYSQYAAVPCTGTLNTAYTGAALTLAPGVYCNAAAVTFTNSTLTLDAQGNANAVWIFKIGTAGTGALTGTNFTVSMANGGNPCNVSWWVAEAATLTTSGFQGDILAGSAITLTGLAGTTTPYNGNIMAKAAVTVTDITMLGCNANGTGSGGSGDHDNDHEKDHDNNGHHDNDHEKCNQGVGNGSEGCDPGHSDMHNPWGSNDENGGTPGNPGRKGSNH